MRKALLGALVAVSVALGLMATPAAARDGHRHDHDRKERSEQVRSERADRDRHDRDWRNERQGDWHEDRHDDRRGDRHDGWDRGDDTLSAEDQAFVVFSARTALAEIFQGQLAIDRSEDPIVQEYGRMMMVDHFVQLGDQLPVMRKHGIELPALTEDQMTTISNLAAATPADFDLMYLVTQVAAHETAIAGFEAQVDNGDNWKVRKLAKKYLPELRHHLDLAHAAIATQVNPAA